MGDMEPTRTPKLAPYVLVRDAPGFGRFLQQALGAEITFEAKKPDGRVLHAEARIADSILMFAEIPPGRAPFPAMLHLYVPDADKAYEIALKAGASSLSSPKDQSDGDRRGGVRDAWGNEWWLTRPPK